MRGYFGYIKHCWCNNLPNIILYFALLLLWPLVFCSIIGPWRNLSCVKKNSSLSIQSTLFKKKKKSLFSQRCDSKDTLHGREKGFSLFNPILPWPLPFHSFASGVHCLFPFFLSVSISALKLQCFLCRAGSAALFLLLKMINLSFVCLLMISIFF